MRHEVSGIFNQGVAELTAEAAVRPRALMHARAPGRPGDAQIPEDLHITDIARAMADAEALAGLREC